MGGAIAVSAAVQGGVAGKSSLVAIWIYKIFFLENDV